MSTSPLGMSSSPKHWKRALQSGPPCKLGCRKVTFCVCARIFEPGASRWSGQRLRHISVKWRDFAISTPKTREILTKHLKERFQIMTEKLGGTEGSREEALTAMSTMVGALTLCPERFDDEQLSDEISFRAARRNPYRSDRGRSIQAQAEKSGCTRFKLLHGRKRPG